VSLRYLNDPYKRNSESLYHMPALVLTKADEKSSIKLALGGRMRFIFMYVNLATTGTVNTHQKCENEIIITLGKKSHVTVCICII